jgi:hypothetical protein
MSRLPIKAKVTYSGIIFLNASPKAVQGIITDHVSSTHVMVAWFDGTITKENKENLKRIVG